MRERSILFARPLVQALLAGRKTQTRRPISPQPERVELLGDGGCRITASGRELRCPFGVAGDQLWVREKWGYERQFFDRRAAAEGPFIYAADGPPAGSHFVPWKPSLHMPRRACRLVLEVKAARAQRVRGVSEADVLAEGYPDDRLEPPLVWFAGIWDQYYTARGFGWEANPWVWVMEFRVLPNASTHPEQTPQPGSVISLRDELLHRLRDRVRQASDADS